VIVRAIVKGRLAATVETRNMFEAECTTQNINWANEQASFEAWVLGIYNAILPALSNLWLAYSIQFQEYVTGSWSDLAEVAFGPGGGVNGDMEEFQSAVLFTARTGGLKILGKKFFAGIAKSSTSGGSLTAGALVYCATALLAYITPFYSTAGHWWNPGVMSKSGVFWQFIGGSVGSILSTMRRRKPGYGI